MKKDGVDRDRHFSKNGDSAAFDAGLFSWQQLVRQCWQYCQFCPNIVQKAWESLQCIGILIVLLIAIWQIKSVHYIEIAKPDERL